jgi:hypothetical protein
MTDIQRENDNITRLLDEIVLLTNMLVEEQNKSSALLKQNNWLRESGKSILDYYRWWWRFMPLSWQRKKRDQRLLEKGLFDKVAYTNNYPDVIASGQDPLRHYLYHGIVESRQPL